MLRRLHSSDVYLEPVHFHTSTYSQPHSVLDNDSWTLVNGLQQRTDTEYVRIYVYLCGDIVEWFWVPYGVTQKNDISVCIWHRPYPSILLPPWNDKNSQFSWTHNAFNCIKTLRELDWKEGIQFINSLSLHKHKTWHTIYTVYCIHSQIYRCQG